MADPYLGVLPSRVSYTHEGCHATLSQIKNLPSPFPEKQAKTRARSGSLNPHFHGKSLFLKLHMVMHITTKWQEILDIP
jgi:hypothetical protein